MHYAFIDECGSVALFLPEDPILALAAVVTPAPRQLEVIVRHAMRRLDMPRAEIKASQINRTLLCRILTEVARESVAIAYVCIDKRGATREQKDPEELYRLAARHLVVACLGEWPSLSITFDRRYTRGYLFDRFEQSLRMAVSSVPSADAVVAHEDSLKRKELQIADCVAWAVAHRFKTSCNDIFRLIADNVIFGQTIELS